MSPATVSSPACWAVVPAAGVGRRMGGGIPKQYRSLRGRPVIAHALARLAAHARIRGVVVVLARDDRWWEERLPAAERDCLRAEGGPERCHSVLNGLRALRGHAAPADWVLVHDAVRPCLRAADIDRLMDALRDHPCGGLLGLPVRDTMKRADARGEVRGTVSREGLWHALTPQMFRIGALADALERVIRERVVVTDEAEAMERAGAAPRMVEGHPDNIKITRERDMALAELYLAHQESEG